MRVLLHISGSCYQVKCQNSQITHAAYQEIGDIPLYRSNSLTMPMYIGSTHLYGHFFQTDMVNYAQARKL